MHVRQNNESLLLMQFLTGHPIGDDPFAVIGAMRKYEFLGFGLEAQVQHGHKGQAELPQ